MTVLIVEDDLGFVFWLGATLAEGGHFSLPAKNVTEAISLVRRLNLAINLLIVNPSVPGVATLKNELRRPGSIPKVLAVGELEDGPPLHPPADAYQRKPGPVTQDAKVGWSALVEGLFTGQNAGPERLELCHAAAES